jgi:cell fate regulator YaaT (PSP1 superfamily)
LQAEVIKADYTIAVSFRHGARAEDYRCNHLTLKVGESCIVDTEHGPNIGTVSRARIKLEGRRCPHRLRNVIRKATKYDLQKEARLKEREAEIYAVAKRRIVDSELKMKLGHLEVTYDEKRVILFFTAENRVDFRDMVKSLASEFGTKVEMRQLGIRDEAKKLGGCGVCGEGLCCSSFLTDFMPVSIRMAKDQGLSLNPTKISGVCGRLMCCLNYENDFYKEMQKVVPKPGKAVHTPNGQGRVISSDYLRQRVYVDLGHDRDRETFEASDVELVYKPQQNQGEKKPKKGKNRPERGQGGQSPQGPDRGQSQDRGQSPQSGRSPQNPVQGKHKENESGSGSRAGEETKNRPAEDNQE